MSTEYWATTVYGIYLDNDQIESMAVKIPEKSKKVKNFHPRTGKFIGMVEEVEQEAYRAIVVNGKHYSNQWDFCPEGCESIEEGLQAIVNNWNNPSYCNNKIEVVANCAEDGQIEGYFVGFVFGNSVKYGRDIKASMDKMDKMVSTIRTAFNKHIKDAKQKLTEKNRPQIHSVLGVG